MVVVTLGSHKVRAEVMLFCRFLLFGGGGGPNRSLYVYWNIPNGFCGFVGGGEGFVMVLSSLFPCCSSSTS